MFVLRYINSWSCLTSMIESVKGTPITLPTYEAAYAEVQARIASYRLSSEYFLTRLDDGYRVTYADGAWSETHVEMLSI